MDRELLTLHIKSSSVFLMEFSAARKRIELVPHLLAIEIKHVMNIRIITNDSNAHKIQIGKHLHWWYWKCKKKNRSPNEKKSSAWNDGKRAFVAQNYLRWNVSTRLHNSWQPDGIRWKYVNLSLLRDTLRPLRASLLAIENLCVTVNICHLHFLTESTECLLQLRKVAQRCGKKATQCSFVLRFFVWQNVHLTR